VQINDRFSTMVDRMVTLREKLLIVGDNVSDVAVAV